MSLLRRSVAAAWRGRRCSTGAGGALPVGEAGEGGWARRVVAGLQPTGALHVGNYFGCVRRLVRAQDHGEDVTVFVADLHALTAPGAGGGALAERSLELAAYLVASGVDPARSTLFAQSAVPRHAELCWVLACLCSHARLAHLPQYRARVAAAAGAEGRARLAVGALLYPVLQAADVLVYRGTHVPVGADQLQHLQLAAQLVRTFHHQYGRAFPTPRALLPEDADGVGSGRVRSLRAPERKMSKSDPDGKSRLLLADADEALRRKVRKAVTDCEPRVTFEPASRPGVANLVALHCLAAGRTPEEVLEECAHLTTAQYKEVVSAAVVGAVGPVRARAQALLARPRALRDLLRAGAARARRRADETYAHVARLAGLAAPAPAPAALLDTPPRAERPPPPPPSPPGRDTQVNAT